MHLTPLRWVDDGNVAPDAARGRRAAKQLMHQCAAGMAALNPVQGQKL
jgi:hypothetical protein